ncbi:hypothetical protein AYI68_g7382 [Smittium mucronatum]|uniref:Uncharacterized protein n=1 Tax=Smittium mucronatum TaxID=133383 RepID=A0A1R0GNV3_9FUNG|nr:hypothetical protein AYI68_g7382 [Smittium mucronatum]
MIESRFIKGFRPECTKIGKGKAPKKATPGIQNRVVVLKKFCALDSDLKVGCAWSQFRGNHAIGLEIVDSSLKGIWHSREDNPRAKTTQFVFNCIKDANYPISKTLVYDGRKIDMYRTVQIEQGVVVINIPNFKSVGALSTLKLIKEQLSSTGTIIDISALCKKGCNTIFPYGMKVLFKKIEKPPEHPSFLDHDRRKISIFYKGLEKACSYC